MIADNLEKLGFSKKEAAVYLVALELGAQPASVIAKKTGFPKATVLFLFDNLVKRGYVARAQRGRVQFFFADPQVLYRAKKAELEEIETTLHSTVPILEELKSPFTIQPKVTFAEGIEACKKAYRALLEAKSTILEFATHDDLVEKFGNKFMNNFIADRVKAKVKINSICHDTLLNRSVSKRNKKELRQTLLFNASTGRFYSSIAIFDGKVLLLNVFRDAFAIIIESPEVAGTLETVHKLIWK